MVSEDFIQENLQEQIYIIEQIKKDTTKIQKIFLKIKNARDNGKKIFVMGNGGSSSTASHFVSDLLKTSLVKKKKRIKAISLTDNIPVLMAWANDTSFENIFSSQLENFVEKGDLVIGISGSGNSKNILNAIKFANKMNAVTIGLSGGNGGRLAKISNVSFVIPNHNMLTIESMHIVICHLLTSMLRSEGTPSFTY